MSLFLNDTATQNRLMGIGGRVPKTPAPFLASLPPDHKATSKRRNFYIVAYVQIGWILRRGGERN